MSVIPDDLRLLSRRPVAKLKTDSNVTLPDFRLALRHAADEIDRLQRALEDHILAGDNPRFRELKDLRAENLHLRANIVEHANELTALRRVADAAQSLIDEKVNRSCFNMDHRSLDSRMLSALRALAAYDKQDL